MSTKLILFCGPSGSGKTTLVKHLLKTFPQLCFSVSATTRTMRANETDGKDYYFLTVDEFHEKIRNDEFLEWEQVYENGYYGTLRSEITRIGALGKHPIFDVDVEGGIHIKGRYGADLLDVFVRPPAIEDLRKRLVARASETPESLERRIKKAELELSYSDRFTHIITNHELHVACAEAEMLVQHFLFK